MSSLYQGPAIVKKRLGINTYLIEWGNEANRNRVHNVINLYPYYGRSNNDGQYLVGIEEDMKVNSGKRDEVRNVEEEIGNVQLGILQGYRKTTQEEERKYKDSEDRKEGMDAFIINEDAEEKIDTWISKKEKWKEKINK